MTDIVDSLSEREIADLMAYAEGKLPERRRAAVEAWIAGSGELRELVRRQRLSLAATRTLTGEAAPASLYAAAAAGRAGPARARRGRLKLALSAVAALAVVLVVSVVLDVGGAPSGPTVADAARLASLPATMAAPAQVPGSGHLSAAVQGLAFPDLAAGYGWRAVGQRRDTVAGRGAAVVYYAAGGAQVGYAIVDSPVLAPPAGAASTVRGGVEFLSFSVSGRNVVTWERDGHTCVMVSAMPPGELVALASWANGVAGSY